MLNYTKLYSKYQHIIKDKAVGKAVDAVGKRILHRAIPGNQCFKAFFKKAVALFDDRSLHIMGGHRQDRKRNTQKPIYLSKKLVKGGRVRGPVNNSLIACGFQLEARAH